MVHRIPHVAAAVDATERLLPAIPRHVKRSHESMSDWVAANDLGRLFRGSTPLLDGSEARGLVCVLGRMSAGRRRRSDCHAIDEWVSRACELVHLTTDLFLGRA